MRLLYLHGFASGPDSRKGRAFDAALSARGHRVERLDLRLPDRDRLRVSAMVAAVERAVAAAPPVVLLGSSLGGLCAARVAMHSADVLGCVLMAPAVGLAARWRKRLGEDGFARWRQGEPMVAEDHAGGPPLRVDFGFYEDADALDAAPLTLLCPSLVFHGTADDVVDIQSSRALVAGAPHARLVELEDGHPLDASVPVMLPEVQEFVEQLEKNRA